MPRLSKEQREKRDADLKADMIKEPLQPNSYWANKYGLCDEAIRKKRRSWQSQLDHVITVQKGEQLAEVGKTTKDQVEGDVAELRQIAFEMLHKALERGDHELLETWWDKATTNAKLRSEMVKSISIFMADKMQVNQVINYNAVAQEVLEGVCPACRQLLLERWSRKPQ